MRACVRVCACVFGCCHTLQNNSGLSRRAQARAVQGVTKAIAVVIQGCHLRRAGGRQVGRSAISQAHLPRATSGCQDTALSVCAGVRPVPSAGPTFKRPSWKTSHRMCSSPSPTRLAHLPWRRSPLPWSVSPPLPVLCNAAALWAWRHLRAHPPEASGCWHPSLLPGGLTQPFPALTSHCPWPWEPLGHPELGEGPPSPLGRKEDAAPALWQGSLGAAPSPPPPPAAGGFSLPFGT